MITSIKSLSQPPFSLNSPPPTQLQIETLIKNLKICKFLRKILIITGVFAVVYSFLNFYFLAFLITIYTVLLLGLFTSGFTETQVELEIMDSEYCDAVFLACQQHSTLEYYRQQVLVQARSFRRGEGEMLIAEAKRLNKQHAENGACKRLYALT